MLLVLANKEVSKKASLFMRGIVGKTIELLESEGKKEFLESDSKNEDLLLASLEILVFCMDMGELTVEKCVIDVEECRNLVLKEQTLNKLSKVPNHHPDSLGICEASACAFAAIAHFGMPVLVARMTV